MSVYHAIPPKDQALQLRSRDGAAIRGDGRAGLNTIIMRFGGPGQSEIETPMMGWWRREMEPCWSSMLQDDRHNHGKTVTYAQAALRRGGPVGCIFTNISSRESNLFYDDRVRLLSQPL